MEESSPGINAGDTQQLPPFGDEGMGVAGEGEGQHPPTALGTETLRSMGRGGKQLHVPAPA